MKKKEFLKIAFEAQCYYEKDWIISCFCINTSKNERNLYPIREEWGVSFMRDGEKIKIEDAKKDEPLFYFKEPIEVDQTWLSNISKPIATTLGNLLVNAVCINYAFGNKIPYIEGPISVSNVENIVAKALVSNVKEGEQEDPRKIYVHEYIKFVDSLQFVSGLADISVWAATAKTMVPPDGLEEYKKKLLETTYAGKLHDPVEVAKFEKDLLKYDDEFLKDDPSYGVFMSGKIKNQSRKKMHLTIGSELTLNDAAVAKPIVASLNDGWSKDPEDFTNLMNGLRAGSYSRGVDTIKGGVAAKMMLRAANAYSLKDTDCGSKLGITRVFFKDNINELVGRYIVVNGKPVLIDEEKANNLLGKELQVRSPMYCQLKEDNTICRCCAGERLFIYPNGVSIPLIEKSGIMLNAAMKKMHSSGTKIVEMDVERAFT